jgi:hypothetical protein
VQLENLNTALVIRRNSKRIVYLSFFFLAAICFLGTGQFYRANRGVLFIVIDAAQDKLRIHAFR